MDSGDDREPTPHLARFFLGAAMVAAAGVGKLYGVDHLYALLAGLTGLPG